MEPSTTILSWNTVPDEIQREVISYLDVKSLCFFAVTSKRSLKNALPYLLQYQQKLLASPHLSIITGHGSSTFLNDACTGLYACGDNTTSQFGLEHRKTCNTFTQLTSLKGKVLSLTVGGNHTVVLTEQGLFVCGYNGYGQLGLGDENKDCDTFTQVTSLSGKVLHVTAGGSHTLALTEQGLFACGYNYQGQLGVGHNNNCNIFTQITSLSGKVLHVTTGINHTLALTDQGLFACGTNAYSQLGLEHNKDYNTFMQITSLPSKVLHVTTGNQHTLVLTDQGLFACGYNNYGQLGLGHNNRGNTFTQITSLPGKVLHVTTGNHHTLALTNQGLFVCGYNVYGQLGLGHNNNCNTFTQVTSLSGKVLHVTAGGYHTLALTEQGLFACGNNAYGQLGLGHHNNCNTFTSIQSLPKEVKVRWSLYRYIQHLWMATKLPSIDGKQSSISESASLLITSEKQTLNFI